MYHKFPAILELGVMLLETVLGERLEPFFEARERVQSTDGLWWYACTVYRENEDYISDITSGGFKSAIHACICPGTFSNYINDDQEMRLKIFQDIVRPLEQDLRAVDELSGDADLAESLTTYDLGVTCNHDKLREGKLLENEKKEAINSFKTLMSRHKIGESGNAALKIAVLDTGIDMSHPIIDDEQSRIKDFKTWCGGRADEDADGHGTHIAGILLDLTRNVDLYIGKIIDTESVESRDHIAQVSRIQTIISQL
ncbi:hypothetical protein K4F52_009876 [Lecanicillium sp. MT-2017a]|nr:hypothetical protein K4F52_009876 [Lecanicillium sp. MT-2017a]